jgi:hypothetical protein
MILMRMQSKTAAPLGRLSVPGDPAKPSNLKTRDLIGPRVLVRSGARSRSRSRPDSISSTMAAPRPSVVAFHVQKPIHSELRCAFCLFEHTITRTAALSTRDGPVRPRFGLRRAVAGERRKLTFSNGMSTHGMHGT